MKSSIYNLFIPFENEWVLYNTLSGSLFLIDDEMKESLEGSFIEKGLKLDVKDIEKLKKARVVVEEDLDERKLFAFYRDLIKYDKSSCSFTVLTTYACNLACPYCYEGKGERVSDTMSKRTMENVIKFIEKTTTTMGSKELNLTVYGGEPLLTTKEWFYILEALEKYTNESNIDFKIGMITNGTLLKKETLDALSRYKIINIQLTLDGSKKIHDKKRVFKNGKGTYDIIIDKIRLLQDLKVPFTIRINVSEDNIQSIDELLDDLKSKGLGDTSLYFSPLHAYTDACQTYSQYCIKDEEMASVIPSLWNLAQKKGFKIGLKPPSPSGIFCTADKYSSYVIDPRGDLYKCWEFVGLPEHVIGKIGDNGELPSVSARYLDFILRDPLAIDDCKECKLLPICGGGCAAAAFSKYGKYEAMGCYLTRFTLEENLKMFVEKNFKDNFKDGKYIWPETNRIGESFKKIMAMKEYKKGCEQC